MTFANPGYLVSPAWLEANLQDPTLRVLDCTVFLHPPAQPGAAFRVESGREAYEQGHIPGAGFADLQGDLSDRAARYRFMMPPAEQFAEAMSRYGVGEGTRVVLYDGALNMWAARIWWMLRAFGFEDAAVLDGGWKRWTAEGRAVSTAPAAYPPARFTARPRPALIASREDVLSAITAGSTCIIDALAPAQYAGETSSYGRAGHIPSALNVPAAGLVDRDTHAYLPAETLRERFAAQGALNAGRVITYCGGGIAASSDAFVLTLLGQPNVAVYDGSLSEWAADPALPLETGAG